MTPTPGYVKVDAAGRVSVYDIKDVDGFVRAVISKVRIRAISGEHEDLQAEGIAILFKLARGFKPRMSDYDRDGSFAGYCSKYLPNKIVTAWHDMHPEHVRTLQDMPDGTRKRRYTYGTAPISLDENADQMHETTEERKYGLNSDSLRTVGDFVK